MACGVLYKMNWLLELTLWVFFYSIPRLTRFLYVSCARDVYNRQALLAYIIVKVYLADVPLPEFINREDKAETEIE